MNTRWMSADRQAVCSGLGRVCVAVLGVLGASGLSACQQPRALALPPGEARLALLDRNWVDRLPETPQERLRVFRFVPKMGGGVFQDRTLYAGHFELFHFQQDGQTLRFHLPHTDEKVAVPFVIDRVPGSGEQSPYDLHLHIEDSPRGPQDYYSPRGEHAHRIEAWLVPLPAKAD